MAFQNPNLLSAAASGFESGTHGWTAGANTALSVVTGQFLGGAQSLRLTASAAGSVQATSPAVTGVTPGTTYVARVPVRVQTAATRNFTARVTFYNASSTSVGSADSVLAALPGVTGWNNGNIATVSMVAPAGAVSARVTFIATALSAADYVNLDEVILTNVDDRPGELLDYATRSAESGTSSWSATNGTLARVSGFLYAGAGFFALGATSAAAGPVALRSVAYYPVTAGTDYVLAFAAQAATALEGTIGLEWYTSADALVSTTELPASFGTAIDRLVVSGVAPAGAAKVRPVIKPTATAAGQALYLDDISLRSPTLVAGNLLTYEEYSTESVLPAWSIDGGTAERGYLTSGISEGFYALKITPDEPGITTASLDRLVPVTPGLTYSAGSTVFRHSSDPAQTVTASVRMVIDWYDADGEPFQAGVPDQFYPQDQPGEFYIQVNSTTRTCPEGAAYARVILQTETPNPLVDSFYADVIFIKESVSEYDLVTNDETGSITLTVNFVPPVAANASHVTITRMDENGRAAQMRAYGRTWDLAPNPYAPIVVEDYEAPLGTRVWYSVQWSGPDGTPKGFRILTRSVDAPVLADPDYVWFKAPGIPALNTRVLMEAPIAWSRAARSTRYDIVGRRNPVHVTGTRAGRQGSITVLIWDPEDNALFDSLLDEGTASLIQAMPGYGVEGNLYVAVGDVEVEPLDPDAREHGWRWTLALTQVDRPDGGLQGSALSTWQNVADGFATWEDVFNEHDTWTDVLTRGV